MPTASDGKGDDRNIKDVIEYKNPSTFKEGGTIVGRTVTAASVASLVILLTAFLYRSDFFSKKKPDTGFLVQELTTTPERQQKALDGLVEYQGKLDQLSPYLADERPLASNDVKFLNTSPKSFEKYYMTEAKTVDEVLIRYICWVTAKCDPGFRVAEIEETRRQVKQILARPAKRADPVR